MQTIQKRIMLMTADACLSDSEKKEKLNQSESIEQQKTSLDVRINNLEMRLDATNKTLVGLKRELKQSFNKGVMYLKEVNMRGKVAGNTVI